MSKVKEAKPSMLLCVCIERIEFYRVENKYDPYLIKDAIQQFIGDELKEKW